MNEKLRNEVAKIVNSFLEPNYIHVDGPSPMEEYGTTYVTKDVLREALNITFTETCKLLEKRRRKLENKVID